MREPLASLGAPAIQVVVSLPSEIDISNANHVGQCLTSVLRPGVSAVIADMTGTTFCDCRGVWALLRADTRAALSGAQLRVVEGRAPVMRVFRVLGLDRCLEFFPSVPVALGAPR